MIDTPHSSFIPRESRGMTPGKVRRIRTFHVFGFIATALFIGSIVTAGGVYFLDRSAQTNLGNAQAALSAQKGLFNPADIAEIREFDRRTQAAEQLIKNHISPLRIFAALEKYTKQNVQFTSFSLEHTPSLEVIIDLGGKTPEFKTLALQESGFGGEALLKNVIFSEVSTSDSDKNVAGGQSGGRSVIFTMKGTLDTSQILYNGTSPSTQVVTTFLESGDTLSVASESPISGSVLGDAIITPSL